MAIHEMATRKTTDLDRVVFQNLKAMLGHHDSWWYPKQQITKLKPQLQVEMAWVRSDKYTLVKNHNNEMDSMDLDSEELANTNHMPPLLEWNQKKVGQ